MCGIVGYVGKKSAKEIVYRGLKRLEYRGYDSAGIALVQDGGIHIEKQAGKLDNLKKVWDKLSESSIIGMGHTRWATHGEPNRTNAHPHIAGNVVVVQNGIIENYNELREELQGLGCKFESQTDTEVFAHLVSREREQGKNLVDAVRSSFDRLKGGSAFVVIDTTVADTIVAVRKDSPLVVGLGDNESLVGSDVQAVVESARDVYYVKDNELVLLNHDGVKLFGADGAEKTFTTERIEWDLNAIEKAGFEHFMLKEIHEQPEAIRATLAPFIETSTNTITLHAEKVTGQQVLDWLLQAERTVLIACGTASYACAYAAGLFERFAHVPATAELASEFRYREPYLSGKELGILVSQSGETADTLAALRMMKEKGMKVIAVCNVRDSTIARDSDAVFYTNAGFEISVASTKAFTTQLAVLSMLVANVAKARGILGDEAQWARAFQDLPALIQKAIDGQNHYQALGEKYFDKKTFLFLGRAGYFTMALEGALKLKEIAYVHAEGYPAGELKHGPIAMVDDKTLVLAIAPDQRGIVHEKTVSNIEEMRARKAVLVGIGADADKHFRSICSDYISLPTSEISHLNAIISIVPLQMFAYFLARKRGTDIDQPRNLAKSVTVE